MLKCMCYSEASYSLFARTLWLFRRISQLTFSQLGIQLEQGHTCFANL